MSTNSGSDDMNDGNVEEAFKELGHLLIDAVLQREPTDSLKSLIDAGAPVWFQNDDEGLSALHAAAYIKSIEAIQLLLDAGAVWNAVDHWNNTAADIALSLNDETIYTLIRDAGIRAELLLTLLSRTSSADQSSSLILRAVDSTATGSTDVFLSSKLNFTKDVHGQDVCLLRVGEEEVGVMMGWETPIMEVTVQQLCLGHNNLQTGLKVLNIGFGLGIIDRLFQSLSPPPSQHVIIEPHPDVLRYMKEQGWYEKPGVTVLEGKWQDLVESERLHDVGGFDVVYTDTFSEDYKSLKDFFEYLPDLLSGPQAKFSFFNGLGANNCTFYDVYTHLSELHLAEVGIDVEWSDVDVSQGEEDDRWGSTRKYFTAPLYRLPIGQMVH